jgi:DNA-binding NtrC family response regulator
VENLEIHCIFCGAKNPLEGDFCFSCGRKLFKGNPITHKTTEASTDGVRAATESADVIRAGMTVADVEKRLILRTLLSVNNNKTRAAAMLGISLKTLHNKLAEYRLALKE